MIAPMLLNYIFSNLNAITLVVWLIFFAVVLVRMWKPSLLKDISYKLLVFIAVGLHFLYGAIATWGQYLRWANGDALGHALSIAPLAKEVPLFTLLEWSRPIFSGAHGYFAFYAFQHFFMSTFALLIIIGLFLAFLVVREKYRPINFRKGDIFIIVLALLIAGWPGVIVLLPIGFIIAVLFSITARIFLDTDRIPLSPSFLIAAPIALLYATPILKYFNLYFLLKL